MASTAIAWKKLEVFPSRVVLGDAREKVQVVVTAFDAQNQLADVNRQNALGICPIGVGEDHQWPNQSVKDNGESKQLELDIKFGELTAKVPVEVKAVTAPKPIAFESEVLVAFSKQGCNSGACHGSPSGKGGFRLSLRAFDAQLDALTLTQEEFGRRINLLEPDKSILLESRS